MKNLSFLFLLLSLLFVGEGRSESFNDFSGGLNTNASWSLIKPNQAYRCENFLLDDPVGALTVRNGYHAISDSLADHKRIYSLNAYRFPAGGSFLFQVVQRDTVTNDCDLYVSDAYGFGLSDKLYDWIYPARGMWVNWLERQYYFNGRQEPVVVSGGSEDFYAQEMTLRAPGQLLAVPVDESGNPDGEYIWTYLLAIPCSTHTYDTTWWRNDSSFSSDPDPPAVDSTVVDTSINWARRCATLSQPVVVKEEKCRLTGFHGYLYDNVCSHGDSIEVMVLRTRANHLKDGDTLFRVATFKTDSASIWNYALFDNLADVYLTDTNAWRTIIDTAFSGEFPVWNSRNDDVERYEWYWGITGPFESDDDFGEGINYSWAPGSPIYINSDTGVYEGDTVTKTLSESELNNYWYQIYHVIYLDTANGETSDTSRGLWTNGATYPGLSPDQHRSRTISLPPTPTSRWARIVLRSDWDPSLYPNWADSEKVLQPGLLSRYHLDTIYDSSVNQYHDHITDSILSLNNSYWERRIADVIFKGAIIHEARMFAWDDFRVWPSAYDTAAIFRLTDNIEFDLDDGDPIIACASFEGYIVIYKTHSMWLLYTDDGTVYDRVKASRGYGAISEATLDYYSGANLVLGPDGLLVSIDNQYRSNATSRNYISQPIKNILLRPVEDMLDAAGKVLGHRYFLSYPGTDSTFVYFFNTSSWGIFTGFDFWQGIIYDTISTADFQTFDDLWFIKDDDERLFIWDESDTTDNGVAFTATWEKQYLERSPAIKQVLTDAYLATEASVPVADSLTLTITDENAGSIGSFKVQLSEMYHRVPVLAENNRVFHHLNVSMEVPNRSNLKITGLDLQVKQAGERE